MDASVAVRVRLAEDTPLGRLVVLSADVLWGFCIAMLVIKDLSASLASVLADEC